MYLSNLGGALHNRYGRTAQLADLEEAIRCYEQAVAQMPANASNLPVLLNNLGMGLHDRYLRTEDPFMQQQLLEQARNAYTRACKGGLTRIPEITLKSVGNWGNWAIQRQSWAEAIQAYNYGRKATEQLYRAQLLRSGKESWLRDAQGLHARAATALAHTGQLREALVALEEGRARGLSEVLERDRADLQQLAREQADLYEPYQQAAERLRLLEIHERRTTLSPETLREEARQAHEALNRAITVIQQLPGYQDFLSQPTWADIEQVVLPGVPLVYLATTPTGTLALIVHRMQTKIAVQLLWANDLTEETLRELLGNWFEDNNDRHLKEWLDTIEAITHQLWQALMGPLVTQLQGLAVQQAMLIPTGLLALLPLHAAWTDENGHRQYALDTTAFSYAPSARALAHARRIGKGPAKQLLAVDEPKSVTAPPLRHSSTEVGAIASLFEKPHLLAHLKATRSALLSALPHAQVAHFSSHGGTNWDEPKKSGLLMTHDELLTVQDLFDLHLTGARLATLSACETGIIGTQLPDEVIALPAAFLQAGFAGVLASLWSVEEISTAMLMESFYRLWREDGFEPALALQAAQRWLRDTTNQEKMAYYEDCLLANNMPESVATAFLDFVLSKQLDERTFEHPFWWAAFYLTGV